MSEAQERRQAVRVESFGRAFVMLNDTAVPYRVENLGSGGALLSGGPPIPWRETLRLVLRVEPLAPIEVDARLVWQGDGAAPRYGVEFLSLDAEAQDAIYEAVGAILAGESAERSSVTTAKLPSWLP
jgi:hypothetical protein